MREPIARNFHAVVRAGLNLVERLEAGAQPDLKQEQERLKFLLDGESDVRNLPDYAGEVPMTRVSAADIRTSRVVSRQSGEFLGIRYGLTCWLDEMVLEPGTRWRESKFGRDWNNTNLEYQIYQISIGADGFWEQELKAEKRPGNDAVEAYYWLAMLGFKGFYRGEHPEEFKKRLKSMEQRINARAEEFSQPADRGFKTAAQYLTGKQQFDRMMQIGLPVAVASATLLAFAFMSTGR